MTMPRSIETIDSSITQDPASASLLPKSDNDDRFNNQLFGHFKGFTITPIQSAAAQNKDDPTKPAPKPPGWIYSSTRNVLSTTVPIKTNLKPAQRTSSFRSVEEDEPDTSESTSTISAPALPPPNASSTARPLISNPVLTATTSQDISTPKMPTRPAPPPPVITTPVVTYISNSRSTERPQSVVDPDKKKLTIERSNSTINKIASMLYPISSLYGHKEESRNVSTLPRSHHKASKIIDKEILRNLEISNPILQKEIELSSPTIEVQCAEKASVTRTQSMRAIKVSQKPQINSFGSMRRPSGPKRPTSMPPVPPVKVKPTKPPENTISEYQQPSNKPVSQPDEVYDDCMNLVTDVALDKIVEESANNDNIYATIEESEYKVPRSLKSSDSEVGEMGLLSEIVSELTHRNVESIYSTKLLAESQSQENLTYENSNHYRSPSNPYSNCSKESLNKTSSLYSKVDNKKKETESKTPTYAAYKGYRMASVSASEPREDFLDQPKTEDAKKNISPDLVSSCSNLNKNSTKSPDVLVSNNASTKVATIKNMHKTSSTPSKYAPVKTTITMPPKHSSLLAKSKFSSINNNNNTSQAEKYAVPKIENKVNPVSKLNSTKQSSIGPDQKSSINLARTTVTSNKYTAGVNITKR